MQLKSQLSADAIYQAVTLVKQNSPLVHNITNVVTMQTIANMLLALGASPIMAHAPEELEDIVAIAQSLVLNIGTLDSASLTCMAQAQACAQQRQIPIILDPVGAGASKYRTESAKNILQRGVSIVRGNASEILALADHKATTKGVDSTQQSEFALQSAMQLSKQYNCCVVISGQQDIICWNNIILRVKHGTPLLTRVTGMGCSATALIGAFAVVIENPAVASMYAMATLGLAAEKAERLSKSPGGFYISLLDTLYSLQQNDFISFDYEKLTACSI